VNASGKSLRIFAPLTPQNARQTAFLDLKCNYRNYPTLIPVVVIFLTPFLLTPEKWIKWALWPVSTAAAAKFGPESFPESYPGNKIMAQWSRGSHPT